MAQTHDGKAFRMLTNIDESTRKYLRIKVARRFDVDAVLTCPPQKGQFLYSEHIDTFSPSLKTPGHRGPSNPSPFHPLPDLKSR
jgi:hypothetical protein